MPEAIKAIVLGIIQGLTEFLPVSSSGHLEIAKYLMADQNLGESSLMMTVMLHFATALSTVVVFRREIIDILRSLRQSGDSQGRRFCIYILVSMIPAAAVGILFEKQIERLFDRQLLLVGLMLAVTGVLLLLADRAKSTGKSVGLMDAILIGIAQAIAILPGISRSGATISTSVLLGVDRSQAARFSFLMVVPLIFGKIGLDVLKAALGSGSAAGASPEVDPLSLGLGFLAAFLTGCLACNWMLRLVKAAQLSWFAYYCFAASALVITAAWLGWFSPVTG